MDNSKHNNSNFGLIIFLVIFAFLSFIVTFKLAQINSKSHNIDLSVVDSGENKNEFNSDEGNNLNEEDNFDEEDNSVKKSLAQSYYINPLKIGGETFYSGDIIEGVYKEHYELMVKYIQIDGLKDEEIESKINEELIEYAFSKVPSNFFGIIQTYVLGNFSNILSLEIYNVYSENHRENLYLNYDLTTGNQIRFEDCFVENANIKNILRNCLYDELSYYDDEYDDLVFEAMYRFFKNDFSYKISNYSIYVLFDNCDVIIPLSKYSDEIAIFNRFITDESIFVDEYDISENIYYGLDKNIEYYYLEDNLLIGLHNDDSCYKCYNGNYFEILKNYLENGTSLPIKENLDGLSQEEKIENELSKFLKNKIENLIEYSKNTPDTMHIFVIEISDLYIVKTSKLECAFCNNLEKDLYKYLADAILLYSDTMSIKKFTNNFSTFSEWKIDFWYCRYYSEDYPMYREYNCHMFYDYPNYSKTEIMDPIDIKYCDEDELNMAYNEILARNGQDFSNKIFRDYFAASLYYLPIYGKTVSLEELSDIERQNAIIIKSEIENN